MKWLRKAKFKVKNHVSKWYVKDEEKGETIDLLEEQLGTGVIMYFRMLKVVIGFMLFCLLLQCPLMVQYSHGKIGDGTLNWLSLGNLGFNYYSCAKRNLRISDELTFKCEHGAKLETLAEFGLQKQNDEDLELNICPISGNEDQLVSLEGLDEECSFENEDF